MDCSMVECLKNTGSTHKRRYHVEFHLGILDRDHGQDTEHKLEVSCHEHVGSVS